ncbi:MAG: hypothetical protein HY931_01160 [Candidatus Falkowbacteria bacterium]|nr:MAG: hypothetical protein HY931_01160 [Candidatus Falkowbacteria bacterium]
MRKSLFLLALMTTLVVGSVFGQFRERVNLSLFAGGYAAQQNANNNGYWYGAYIDYMPIKTETGWLLGFCAVGDRVYFKSNTTLSRYDGSSDEMGIGLAGGKWSEFLTQKYSGYFGANLMLKSVRDNGTGKSVQPNHELGVYDAKQEDLILSGELNINLLKAFGIRENLLPRSQLKLTYQKPIKSEKTSFWNDAPIKESMIWNKSAFGAEIKQSILQIGRGNTLVEPKIMIGYHHYVGDDSQWLSAGPEIALKKRGWDDFLSIYCFWKQQTGSFEPNLNSGQFVFGINLMPFNIRR